CGFHGQPQGAVARMASCRSKSVIADFMLFFNQTIIRDQRLDLVMQRTPDTPGWVSAWMEAALSGLARQHGREPQSGAVVHGSHVFVVFEQVPAFVSGGQLAWCEREREIHWAGIVGAIHGANDQVI